ncbi:MAG: hypothetical protein AAF487_01315 [Bacteroidota bacterium]
MKKVLRITIWMVLIASFFTLLSFSTLSFNERICNTLIFEIEKGEEYPLINESTLDYTLSQNEFRIEGQKITDIPVDQIENKIKAISQVKEAKVFSDIAGQLHISVIQKEPVARIFNSNGESYYIDLEGSPIDLSALHAARLVSITSANSLDFRSNEESKIELKDDLLSLLRFIEENPMWKHQIVQIHIDTKQEIELTPRIGNHKILVGNASDLRTKFEKLRAFYANCDKGNYWNAFSTVNLKYKDQIVCTKK